MLQTHRAKILVLLLLAGGLAAGAVAWRANTRTTTGTTGGGDVFTDANKATDCMEQASAFADYPLVFAGPSVLGYPLTYCDHAMTKTRRTPDGQVSHPGGDSWGFQYGSCTVPDGRESCAPPISIIIDPCARLLDGRIIPWPGRPTRSLVVRGAEALIGEHDIIFEQSPQQITIYASGSSPDTAEQVANAVKVAEALIPANGLADGLSKGASLTAMFLQNADAFCATSSGASTTPIADPTTIAIPPVTPAVTDPTATTSR